MIGCLLKHPVLVFTKSTLGVRCRQDGVCLFIYSYRKCNTGRCTGAKEGVDVGPELQTYCILATVAFRYSHVTGMNQAQFCCWCYWLSCDEGFM